MTGRLLALDLVVSLAVAAAWLGAVALAWAGRRRPAAGLLAAAVVLTGARIGVVAALSGAGWWFVQEKVLLTLPLLALPGAAAAVLAGPALARGRAPRRTGMAALVMAAAGAVCGVLGTVVVGYPATLSSAVALVLLTALPGMLVLWPTRPVRAVAAVAALAVGAGIAGAWWSSLLPDRITHGGSEHAGHGYVSVGDLTGPVATPGEQVRRFTVTARRATVQAGERTVPAWTFDGSLPGPEIRVRQGELVEVTLRNADVSEGVTLHWHGYPVPNREDGVAGVTQDAVPPGGEFVYRFRATVAGTYWYHSHQDSHEAVRRGLYGAFVVEPAAPAAGLDLAVPLHTLDGAALTGPVAGLLTRAVPPGTPVRLRMIGTDSEPHLLEVRGTGFRLAAVDGHEIDGAELAAERLPLPAGGRFDLTFTMPAGPAAVLVDGRAGSGVVLSPDGAADVPPGGVGSVLDVTRYGAPAPLPDEFDRRYTIVLDRGLRFLDGLPRNAYTVDGAVWPNVPAQLVRQGELVELTVVNRGSEPHPMHPHGHTVQVLSRNGVPASGALWTDSFEVGPGEMWQVALRADNPGIWMNHCHNLDHAVDGMVIHLAYEGVTSPFTIGAATGNHPE